jgi:hypothetical protein
MRCCYGSSIDFITAYRERLEITGQSAQTPDGTAKARKCELAVARINALA